MRPEARRRLQLFLKVVLVGTVVGIGYGSLVGYAWRGAPLFGALVGAIHGSVISATIGLVEVVGARSRLIRHLNQAPLLVMILIKGLLYGTVISLVVLGELGPRLIGRPTAIASTAVLPLSVAFSFMVTFAFLFVLQMAALVGPRTLLDIVRGRYHRPRTEERFFLFVDLAGSTALAERLGPTAMHHFLNRVFRVAGDPIDDHEGEIYQYVGDEMVITWRLHDGWPAARPVDCFFAIEAALAASAPGFARDFGATPRLRAALHAGPVTAGEVGENRRAIVFHGDVMNTAARLEQATRELERGFLVSVDARARLGLDPVRPDGYAFEDLGPRMLRGRAAPVHVYAVKRGSGPAPA